LLARVHIAPKELGLSQYEYEAALERFGATSARDLSGDQLGELDKYFQSLGWKPKPKKKAQSLYAQYLKKWEALGHRPGMATAAQLAKIEVLWDSLEWFWNKDGKGKRNAALRGFLKKRFERSDPRMLTFEDAHKVIEALKAINRR